MTRATVSNPDSYALRKSRMRLYLSSTFNAPPIVVRDAALMLCEATCGHSKWATLRYVLRKYAGDWWMQQRVRFGRKLGRKEVSL